MSGAQKNGRQKGSHQRNWWYLLFLVQFAGILWPPLYNRAEPAVLGVPFFYWFQLAWVIVSAGFTAVVYFATRE
jgi:Protein of unknown function (DUF3311)